MALEVLTFAAVAGALAFFSPCGIALIPAYLGFSTTATNGLRMGVLSGLGAGATAAILGLVLSAIGSAIIATRIIGLGLLMGLLLVALGIVMMTGRWRGISIPVPRFGGDSSPFLFGIVFAITGAGCTLPVLLAAMAQATTQGPAIAGLAAVAYGGSLGAMMLVAGVIGGRAGTWARDALRAGASRLDRMGGAIVTLAGMYVMLYYADQAGLVPTWVPFI